MRALTVADIKERAIEALYQHEDDFSDADMWITRFECQEVTAKTVVDFKRALDNQLDADYVGDGEYNGNAAMRIYMAVFGY